jgi:hypothetical protein
MSWAGTFVQNPTRQPPYEMSRYEIEELRRYLKKIQVKEFIRVSRFHVVFFVIFVK